MTKKANLSVLLSLKESLYAPGAVVGFKLAGAGEEYGVVVGSNDETKMLSVLVNVPKADAKAPAAMRSRDDSFTDAVSDAAAFKGLASLGFATYVAEVPYTRVIDRPGKITGTELAPYKKLAGAR